MQDRILIRKICIILFVFGVLRFLYGGVYSPARHLTGDFYSAFPAPYVEAYQPTLLQNNIFVDGHVSVRGDWSYGPGFHLLTSPLTLLSSYRIIDTLVLAGLYILTGLTFWFFGRKVLLLSSRLEWLIMGLLWLNFTPLHASFGQRAIELVEMFLVVWMFASWKFPFRGGIFVGLAATIKFLPALIIPYLVWKRRWVTAGIAIVALVFILAVMSAFLPWENSTTLREYQDMTFGEGHRMTHANNQSLVNLVQRVFLEKRKSDLFLVIKDSKRVRQLASWINLIALSFLAIYALKRFSPSRAGPLALECGILLAIMVMLVNRNQTYYLALTLPGISAAAIHLFREVPSPGRVYSRGCWAVLLILAYLMMSPPVPMRLLDMLRNVPLSASLDDWKVLGGPGLGGLILLVVLIGVHTRKIHEKEVGAIKVLDGYDFGRKDREA